MYKWCFTWNDLILVSSVEKCSFLSQTQLLICNHWIVWTVTETHWRLAGSRRVHYRPVHLLWWRRDWVPVIQTSAHWGCFSPMKDLITQNTRSKYSSLTIPAATCWFTRYAMFTVGVINFLTTRWPPKRHNFCWTPILTDFQNSFTATFCHWLEAPTGPSTKNFASTSGRRYGSTNQCLSIHNRGPLVVEIATTFSRASAAVSEWVTEQLTSSLDQLWYMPRYWHVQMTWCGEVKY